MDSDADLLHRFTKTRDELAFRKIVERHAPMVYGVALRGTQAPELAEEITQSVFTILSGKANHLHHSELAGWLHRTAVLEACNARRKEARRHQALTEHTRQMIPETSFDKTEWLEMRPVLDETIDELSSEDRRMVIMRFFEQRSYLEIASALGKSEAASRKQMERALDRLGARLRGRGIATSGVLLGALMTTVKLCTQPSSAANLAAVALQTAPAFTTASLLTTMAVTSILKSAGLSLAIGGVGGTVFFQLAPQDLVPSSVKLQSQSGFQPPQTKAPTSIPAAKRDGPPPPSTVADAEEMMAAFKMALEKQRGEEAHKLFLRLLQADESFLLANPALITQALFSNRNAGGWTHDHKELLDFSRSFMKPDPKGGMPRMSALKFAMVCAGRDYFSADEKSALQFPTIPISEIADFIKIARSVPQELNGIPLYNGFSLAEMLKCSLKSSKDTAELAQRLDEFAQILDSPKDLQGMADRKMALILDALPFKTKPSEVHLLPEAWQRSASKYLLNEAASAGWDTLVARSKELGSQFRSGDLLSAALEHKLDPLGTNSQRLINAISPGSLQVEDFYNSMDTGGAIFACEHLELMSKGSRSLSGICNSWAQSEAYDCSAYVNAMPTGSGKYFAMKGLVSGLKRQDPENAAIWQSEVEKLAPTYESQ